MTEKDLDRIGVAWEFVEAVPLSSIDIDASLRNQARVGAALDDEHLSLIQEGARQGDQFPPIVLMRKNGTAKSVVGDGNHRVFVARNLKWETWPFGAYVVTGATEVQQWAIITEANLVHGRPASLQDRLSHAARDVEVYGMTRKDAALKNKIAVSSLEGYLRRQESLARATRLGFKKIASLADTSIEALGRIPIDGAFVAAAELAVEHNLPLIDVQELSKNIRAAKSESAMVDIIAYEHQRLQADHSATLDRNVKGKRATSRVWRACGLALSLTEAEVIAIPAERKDDAKQKMSQARQHLSDLIKRL